MPLHRILASLIAASATLVSAEPVDPSGSVPIPITSLPTDFDNSTLGAPNTITSVASCPGLTSLAGGEVVYTFLTGFSGIGNHIDFDLTPQPGFIPVIYVLATEGDGSSCVGSSTTLLPNGMVRLHLEETLVSNQRYYVYVDSIAAGGGAFHLFAWVFIGVELQSFGID